MLHMRRATPNGSMFQGDRKTGGTKIGCVRRKPQILYGRRFVIPLFVNGVECEGFRDTGSDILIVREDLVEDRGRYTEEVMSFRSS